MNLSDALSLSMQHEGNALLPQGRPKLVYGLVQWGEPFGKR